MTDKLRGVIAAVATAIDASGEPDCARSTALARFLLANGCDGLNVLGTTGEATSFSLEQRKRLMSAYRAAALPMDRLMVGTGAAALDDAIAFHGGDAAALEAAITIRKLFDGKQLVPGVKALLAHIHTDQAWARVKPPLAPFELADRTAAIGGYDHARAAGAAASVAHGKQRQAG